MNGVSFIRGYQLPPISVILSELQTVVMPNSHGGYMLVAKENIQKNIGIFNYLRTDIESNSVVTRDSRGCSEFLGPIETVMFLVGHPDGPMPHMAAFEWIVKNIKEYKNYSKWPHVTALPIIDMDWDKDCVRDDLCVLHGIDPNAPCNDD